MAALWRDDTSSASALLPRLSGAARRVAEARIALQRRRTRGLQPLVDAAMQAAPNDAGLLYDRARYIRRSGRPEDALAVIVRADPAQAPEMAQAALNEERRLFVNRALRAGQAEDAYKLVSQHALSRGVDLAETEWLAGFVAFRFLRDYDKAKQHWTRLRDNVSTPVSLARAFYWLGRAAEKGGDQEAAQQSFTEASQYGFTYYGQLARERLGGPPLTFISDVPIGEEQRAAFENRELVRAIRLVSAVGDRADYEALAFGLDDLLTTPEEHSQLSAIARGLGYEKAALRSAKAGLRRGVVAGDAAYPVLDLPPGATGSGRAEPALTLAIVRQESEFDAAARSGANARGLMQILNSTGAATARRIGVSYAGPSALYTPETNLTLGSAYLQSLVNQFDGSYVLAIAAYNAGPSRSNEWMGYWGDPRTRGVDPVEWVELIPFEETRNYVQRVLENLQVYRHRLAGKPQPVRLTEDLRRGGV
jgi:soluble lytic murein transglycosylase